MFPTKLKGKKTPAGKYVEDLFDIWMFVKSKMLEQPRVNQILICMLENEMYNLGMVLCLFQIFHMNKLLCVCRYTYYFSGYLGLGKKIYLELILCETECEWEVFCPCVLKHRLWFRSRLRAQRRAERTQKYRTGGNVRPGAHLTPYPSFQIGNQITDQHHHPQEMNTQLSVGVAQRISSHF